jgi:DNA-binding PadR family transcriptional regulator
MAEPDYLGQFEHMVLLAVLRLGDEAYGGSVLEEIERRTGRAVARGALYVTLDRLEAKGLLASRAGEAVAGRGGRPRRLVRPTAAGLRALRASHEALRSLWAGLEGTLEPP